MFDSVKVVGMVNGGSITGDLASTSVTVMGTAVIDAVSGGGASCNIGVTNVHIQDNATITGSIQGGNGGNSWYTIGGSVGTANITMTGGTLGGASNGYIYGGSGSKIATDLGTTTVGTTNVTMTGGVCNYVVGGGAVGVVTTANVTIGGTALVNTNVFGGGLGTEVTNTNVTINGGAIDYSVYGGGMNSDVQTARVNILGGELHAEVHGGGYSGATATPATVHTTTVTVSGGTFTGGQKSTDGGGVYAGGKTSSGVGSSAVTLANITISGGSGINNISSNGLRNTTVDSASITVGADVTIGSNGILAIENGSTFTLNSGAVLTVEGTVANTGSIIDNGLITLGADKSCPITSGSGFVRGKHADSLVVSAKAGVTYTADANGVLAVAATPAEFTPIPTQVKTVATGTTAKEQALVAEIMNNLSGLVAATGLEAAMGQYVTPDGTNGTLAFIKTALTDLVEVDGAVTLTFDIEPYMSSDNGATQTVIGQLLSANGSTNNKPITFRLPVPASITHTYATIVHGAKDLGALPIRTDENGNKYVEVSVTSFSVFTVTFHTPVIPGNPPTGDFMGQYAVLGCIALFGILYSKRRKVN